MIITALIFAFYGTYISRRWILKKYANKTKGTDSKENDKNNKSMKANTPLQKIVKQCNFSSYYFVFIFICFTYNSTFHLHKFLYASRRVKFNDYFKLKRGRSYD